MGAEEKRAHPRAAVRYAVSIKTSLGKEFAGTVENLGALGALVSTPDFEAPLDVGDWVSLAIETDDRGALSLEGEILRLEQEFSGGDIRRSFAVRFREAVA